MVCVKFVSLRLKCGNKMPTRCNRGFYCRSYCLLNMFRAPLCPSWGAQEYYTVVAACGISCCGFQVAGLVWSWGLCVQFAGCWFTGSVLWRVWCGWLKVSWKRGFGSFRDCSGISLPAWWRDWMWNCSEGSNMLSCWMGLRRAIVSANVPYSCRFWHFISTY